MDIMCKRHSAADKNGAARIDLNSEKGFNVSVKIIFLSALIRVKIIYFLLRQFLLQPFFSLCTKEPKLP